MKKIICILFLGAHLTITAVHAQPGSLDLSFSTDGMVSTDIGNYCDEAQSVAIQNDGKIVVAGYSYNGIDYDFALVRYNSDGSLDNSFDSDGIVITDILSNNDYGHSLAIQGGGKIIVVGTSSNGSTDIALVRYNNDGSLDNSFDLDGIVITDILSNNNSGSSIAIQDDGKILVAGWSYSLGWDFALSRYNIDGSLDNTFGFGGITTTDIAGGLDYGFSVTIQGDGKILVAGRAGILGYNDDIALVRYCADGSLDYSFDFDGKVTTAIGATVDEGRSVSIQTDGKILVAGYSGTGSGADIVLVRYNTNGSLDNTFDLDGIVTTDLDGNSDYANSVTIQSDGKILLAGGTVITGTEKNFALVRYNNDGSLDNTFDFDGRVNTDFGSNDRGQSIAIQPDGKIVVAGCTGNSLNERNFALARYNNDIVGIEENNFENINVYPNPVIGEVTISVDKILYNVSMKLINTTGQIIMEQENLNGNSFTFDISSVANGIYYIQLKTENEFFSQKIIKQ